MIRKATEDDCINLAALSLEVWFNTYAFEGIDSIRSQYAISSFTETKFRELLGDPVWQILVKVEDTFLRGYVLINLKSFWDGEKNGFEIDKLYVHSTQQGKGIGKALLCEVKKLYGKAFWLHTWVYNDKSIAFYKKYGFEDIGRYDFIFGEEVVENRVLRYTCT